MEDGKIGKRVLTGLVRHRCGGVKVSGFSHSVVIPPQMC